MELIAKLLRIAGSDSSGGAGVQADVKTASKTGSALGLCAAPALNAITAQTARGVRAIDPLSPEIDSPSPEIDLLSPEIDPLSPEIVAAHISAGLDDRVIDDRVIDDRMIDAEKIGLLADAGLMKGGLGRGPTCVDRPVTADAQMMVEAPRLKTCTTHGTGGSRSSAMAAELAEGSTTEDAGRRTHDWLHGANATADRLSVGLGQGPVPHFHEIW